MIKILLHRKVCKSRLKLDFNYKCIKIVLGFILIKECVSKIKNENVCYEQIIIKKGIEAISMAILKCKMCGGDLEIFEDMSVCECEYCGTRQTVPAADDDKKIKLFDRANKLRANCEFDKAAGVYENIVATYSEEAEGYWGLLLCRYGIEYVDDPATGKKIPTCHRSSFESIMDDVDFEMVMENSDSTSRAVYREEAKYIEGLRKSIIEVSGKEEPYDIFICYKETDENGDRTLDSVLAQDVYDALTQKGYRVFFSRITLESKLGLEYEPYIFAALNSAKVMLAFGTSYDYYNAVWVKNEWSRYIKLMAQDKTKHLIPCFKNLDAYDIPKEFAKFQSQDMGKIGALQDLIRGIEKLVGVEEKVATPVITENISYNMGGVNGGALIKRGYMALEDREWDKAVDFFEQVLNINAEEGMAYWGELLAQYKCNNICDFADKLYEVLKTDIEAENKWFEVPEWHEDIKDKYVFWEVLEQEEQENLFKRVVYKSRVASITAIIDGIKVNFILSTNNLFQRASQYANEVVASNIQQLKDELDKLLHKELDVALEEEKEAHDAVSEEANIYYSKVKDILDKLNEVAISNAKINEEKFRRDCEQWERDKERYRVEYQQWEMSKEQNKLAYQEWEQRSAAAMQWWNNAKQQYAQAKAFLEAKKEKLVNEMADAGDGVFGKWKISQKEKELIEVRTQLSALQPPIKPAELNPPVEIEKPVLRDQPILTYERKIGKDEIMSILKKYIESI